MDGPWDQHQALPMGSDAVGCVREGTARTGVTLSSSLIPCPGAALLSLLLGRSATELSLSHRLCPQKITICALCHLRKQGLCGSPAVLSMVFLQQRISPLKEQCHKSSLLLQQMLILGSLFRCQGTATGMHGYSCCNTVS